MKPIKKFSMMATATDSVNESATANHDAVMDLVKKMGYESVEELKKEKNLLSKLEALLKDFTPKEDISEDEIEEDRAEDIEAELKKKGEPRSLEGEEGEKEEDKEVGAAGEVAETDEVEEDKAEEIEDEVLAKGEPKDLEDKAGDKVSDDPAITDEVPAEGDDEESGKEVEPAAKKRIMAFEDFIKEKEVTVNKNVKYHDDDEEPEDYSVPVAEEDEMEGEEDEKKGDELEDKGDVKVDSEDDKEKEDHYAGAVKSDDAEIDALKKDVEYDKEEEEDDEEDMHHKKEESRIMSFSKFVNEAYGSDDEEEVDEYGMEEDDYDEEEEMKEAVGEVKTQVTGDEIADEEVGADGIAIPAEGGDGSETAAGIAGDIMDMGKPKDQPESKGEELVTKDQNITAKPETAKDEADVQGTVVVKEEEEIEAEEEEAVEEAKVSEKEIKDDAEFKEYATAILKDAHGDKFDEAKAKEVIDGLLSKYSGDYGAMVGALQSSMGS